MDFHKRQRRDYQGGVHTDADKEDLEDTLDRFITQPNRIRDWKGSGTHGHEEPYKHRKDRFATTKKREKDGVVKGGDGGKRRDARIKRQRAIDSLNRSLKK